MLLGARVQKLSLPRTITKASSSQSSAYLSAMSATSGFSRMFLTRLSRVTGTSFGFSSRAMKIEAASGRSNGYRVRFAHPVGGSETGHPLAHEEGGLILTQYAGDRPQT